MTKNKYLYLEIGCVAVLLLFIVLLFAAHSGGTQKRVKEIAAPVIQEMDVSEMKRKSAMDAAKVFGFETEKEEGILYYTNENIMDCSELLIIKLKDEKDAPAFKKLVEKRVEDQKNLFKNYAPEQYALLQKSVIEINGNTLFYCTAKNADAVYAAFKKAL